MNLKGYVSVRSPVPVSVQNLVLRDYCQKNGHTLSLADVEFLTNHKMLESLLTGLDAFDGVCAYSMWIFPEKFILPANKEIHLALENYVLPRDLAVIQELFLIKMAVK